MSIDQSKKWFCNICGYCVVIRWVKPSNISRSIFWFLSLIFGVIKISFEPTFLQSIFVLRIITVVCKVTIMSSFSIFSTIMIALLGLPPKAPKAIGTITVFTLNFYLISASKYLYLLIFSSSFPLTWWWTIGITKSPM